MVMRSRNSNPDQQLTLFDTSRYEKARSHYDLEDGDDAVEWPPLPVKETDWPPDVVSDVVTESLDIADAAVTESTEDLNPAVDSVTTWREKSINRYRPRGTARCGEYYRFSYKWYGRVKHRHIPGGNCSNPVAIARVEAVRLALIRGKTTAEVLELIDSFRKPR